LGRGKANMRAGVRNTEGEAMNYQKLTEIASAGPLEVHEDENGWCEVVRKERTVVAGIKFRDTVGDTAILQKP